METDLAMSKARKLVEAHIEAYGMLPHPDRLKEAIAALVDRENQRAEFVRKLSEDTEDLETNYPDKKVED